MIGEATHGTEEFYRIRAEITKKLIEEKQFGFVMLEANYSETKKVRDYVYGLGSENNAGNVLKEAYKSFPKWMWTYVIFFHSYFHLFSKRIRDFFPSNLIS